MSASPRTLPIPADFRQALKQCGLLGFFVQCAYVHRAGYLHWVSAPVRRETRRERIQQAVMRLAAQRAEVLVAAMNTQRSA